MPDSEYAPHPVQPDVTAFILTGGKSERMGQDKALLRLPSGTTLIEHALGVASAIAGQVGIVGPRERYAGYAWAGEFVQDIFPERGPLGGIHAALTTTTTEWNVILAVDLPRMTTDALRWMLSIARQSGAEVTVPDTSGQLHPLCGIYRKNFKARAEDALKQGKNKVAACFDPKSLRVVSEEEVRAGGFEPGIFINVNTAEEFQKLIEK
jgi:molybdopterin-guanine dinucleotide biosynthesis protein A